MSTRKRHKKIETFALQEGRKLGSHYEVIRRLGGGTEGEVYQVREVDTGILRAAKLYFPHVDPKKKQGPWHARKLHRLRHCEIVLQYHHTQAVTIARESVLCLISDLSEGDTLDRWVAAQPGGRLTPFIALHVLYALARGIEPIHAVPDYHSDVHTENILVRPLGVNFDIKLIDFYDWGRFARYKQQQDILHTVRVFYDILGGRRFYPRLAPELKYIVGGLQHKIILKRFPTMSELRLHLETFAWTSLR
ncbi:MAG: serine/threonine protein kinase [Myxococcota bacterium]